MSTNKDTIRKKRLIRLIREKGQIKKSYIILLMILFCLIVIASFDYFTGVSQNKIFVHTYEGYLEVLIWCGSIFFISSNIYFWVKYKIKEEINSELKWNEDREKNINEQ